MYGNNHNIYNQKWIIDECKVTTQFCEQNLTEQKVIVKEGIVLLKLLFRMAILL